MLIFSKAKLVFFSVPKTGSTAIEEALAPMAAIAITNPPELKHAPVYRYNRFFRPMVEKFIGDEVTTVAVVREPISWLGSWYRYRQREFLDGKPTSTKGMSFSDFVTAYLQDDRPAYANVGSQAKFVEPRPNGTSITNLFQYEQLDTCLSFLEKRIGVNIHLSKRNTSPVQELTLNKHVEARLRQQNAADFSLWSSLK